MPTTRLVRCPRCRKSARFDATNVFRPFCSALCKNEDIISWAEGGYKIPGKAANEEDGAPRPSPEDEED